MSRLDEPQDEELGALYRAAAQEVPSPGLNARILGAARAAATPPRAALPVPQPKSWVQRWRIPVALAATVLMTSTLTLLVREHEVDGVGSVLPERVPAERKSEAAATAAPTPAPPASVAPTSPAPQPAPRQANAGPGLSRADRGVHAERRAKTAGPERADRGEADTAKDRLADRPREASPSLAQPDLAAKRTAPNVTESAAGAASMQSAPAAASAEPAMRPAPSGQLERSPEQWLTEIRELRREGRTAEADERLAAFRKHYPQFPLPADMKRP